MNYTKDPEFVRSIATGSGSFCERAERIMSVTGCSDVSAYNVIRYHNTGNLFFWIEGYVCGVSADSLIESARAVGIKASKQEGMNYNTSFTTLQIEDTDWSERQSTVRFVSPCLCGDMKMLSDMYRLLRASGAMAVEELPNTITVDCTFKSDKDMVDIVNSYKSIEGFVEERVPISSKCSFEPLSGLNIEDFFSEEELRGTLDYGRVIEVTERHLRFNHMCSTMDQEKAEWWLSVVLNVCGNAVVHKKKPEWV